MPLPDLVATSWLALSLAAVLVGLAKTAIGNVATLAVVLFVAVLLMLT